MLGVWLENGELSVREDIERPVPPAGEALIRVTRGGICATDHGLIAGMYPFHGVLGHEFVGVVEEGPESLLGKRVVGEINAVCHECRMCRAGLERHCDDHTVLGIIGRHGAFAEYTTLPVENLHVVPSEVSDAQAVFTEPLAAALEIQEQVRVGPDQRVLLVGDGRLGQLIAQTLALTGCDLVALGRHESKLAYLSSRGISTTTSADIEPKSFDLAVECTGNESGLATAQKALRPRGTLVLKSTYPGTPSIDATMLVVDEITVVGSRCGPFAPALRLLERGLVDVSYLENGCFPLSDALAAFERSGEREVLKVVLEVG